jgi:hypothetical protein
MAQAARNHHGDHGVRCGRNAGKDRDVRKAHEIDGSGLDD